MTPRTRARRPSPPPASSVVGEEDPGAALDADAQRAALGRTGTMPCGRCGGSGRVNDTLCPTCGGSGRVARSA